MTSFHAAPKGVADINERQVITPEQVDLAEKLKNEANVFFKERKYDDAIRLYTEAIELNPSVPAYYCNRAL
ncbi:Serine/threonine-protein phosphatase 5, partial [Tieghemiomyces parasiticus]